MGIPQLPLQRIQQGSLDKDGEVIDGDDMVLNYVTLYRGEEKWQKGGRGKMRTFRRVRYRNPELHLDHEGEFMKYWQPAGSGTRLWIPETVLLAYEKKDQHKILVIIEGELKAEALCKIGVMAVGIPGIHQLAQDRQLPGEIVSLVKEMGIRHVVFIVDSDWDRLSAKLKTKPFMPANLRPHSFYSAVRSYKDFMGTLYNLGINVDLWWGSNRPHKNQKGIDDLLAGDLKGQEKKVVDGLTKITTSPSETDDGDIWLVRKITTLSDSALRKQFGVTNVAEFADMYRDQLKELPKWKFWKTWYRLDDKLKPVLDQTLEESEKFWRLVHKKDRTGEILSTEVQFVYRGFHAFCRKYGFARMKTDGGYLYIHGDNRQIKAIDGQEVADFTIQWCEQEGLSDVVEMLLKGADRFFGAGTLKNLPLATPPFVPKRPGIQDLLFADKFWRVNHHDMKPMDYTAMEGFVWKNRVMGANPRLMPEPLFEVTYSKDHGYQYTSSNPEAMEKCQFLRFLWLTSIFDYKKEVRSDEDMQYTLIHFLNKITAFAYLCHEWKNPSFSKAVVAMDGVNADSNSSNGRTGKSLFGAAVERVVSMVRLDGKDQNLTKNPFLYQEVKVDTSVIFVDDARRSLDFEHFFSSMTSGMTINRKGEAAYTLPPEHTPKFLFTTNFAIGGEGSSFRDRILYLTFSDYFNDKHKPIDEFGNLFFTEWDDEQWGYFWNFTACALRTYFQEMERTKGRSGVIEAPDDRVQTRRIRQEIGEDFLSWADEFWMERLGERIQRSEAEVNFRSNYSKAASFINAHIFRRKLIAWASFRGLLINAHLAPQDNGKPSFDKSGGSEYYTITKA